MNIAVDLDGVIFDTQSNLYTYGELFDIEIGGKGMVRPYEPVTENRYDWSESNRKKFFFNTVLYAMEVSPVMPYCQKVLNLLRQRGHKIIIITGRGIIDPQEEVITLNRLAKEKIEYDKIIFKNYPSKAKACLEEKIDLIIDDNYEVIEDLSKLNILCFQYMYVGTIDCNKKNVIPVKNWGEIYRKFLEIEK